MEAGLFTRGLVVRFLLGGRDIGGKANHFGWARFTNALNAQAAGHALRKMGAAQASPYDPRSHQLYMDCFFARPGPEANQVVLSVAGVQRLILPLTHN